MQKPNYYDPGEVIGCFEVIRQKEVCEGPTTKDGNNIWICKCIHTEETCKEWKPKCLKVERDTKKLNRNKPTQKCREGSLVKIPISSDEQPESDDTGKRCFESALEAVIVFDPISLKRQARQYYSTYLNVDDIKPLFKDMYDDLYVNPLGYSAGDKIEMAKVSIKPIKWQPIVAQHVNDVQHQIPLWNVLIGYSKRSIYEGIVEFIKNEIERRGDWMLRQYPNLDIYTAQALSIGTIKNPKQGYVEDEALQEYEFYKNPDFKRKYVSQYAAITKEKCLDELISHLIDSVTHMVDNYNKGTLTSTSPITINQIFNFKAEIDLDVENKKVRVCITKQP